MVSPAEESTFGAPVVVSKTGGRRRKRKTRRKRKKFKKHYMWNTKGKRYMAKTYKQHIKGKKLGHTHKKPKRKRRRTRRRRTRRRRTRRRRMRGGFKNPIELNKKVMDPPIPSKNIRLSDVNVPGVQLGGRVQRGGGAMDIVPGWNDLVDIGRTALVGTKNFYHQLNGDDAELSPLAHKDQYRPRRKLESDFPDIGNIHEGAEKQASEFKLNN